MTIFGWDMSHYDASDPGSAYAEGIRFITHKAGGDGPDAELAPWWGYVRRYDPAKILLGAYWVLLNRDGAAEADRFVARLDGQCPGWRERPFILQLDCESWNGGATPAPTKEQIQTCARRLEVLAPKLRPIVYAPAWVYGASLSGLGHPLWASRYVAPAGHFVDLYPGDESARWEAYSGQVPAILQYTSSATIGGQTTCDANAFRGTLAELTALVAPGWVNDVSEQDVTNALNKFFAPAGDPAAGTYTTRVGRDALNQSVPNPLRTGKTSAWQLLADIASALRFENAEVPPTAAQNAQAVVDILGTTSVHDLESILRQGLTPEGRHALAAALQVD